MLDVIEFSDYEFESLMEMLCYIYIDEVILSGSNVMEVLYLFRCYKLFIFFDKCIEFFRKNLNVLNVINVFK